MSKKEEQQKQQENPEELQDQQVAEKDQQEEEAQQTEEKDEEMFGKKKGKNKKENKLKDRIDELEQELAELKDKNLRLFAEFDNFRKRTAKERNHMVATAGQEVIRDLLPILDDIKRGEEQMEKTEDVESLKKGYELITKKLRDVLHNKGLKEMETIGKEFDPDLHEAITEIPAPTDDDKGKVLDEVERGYYLNDRILRHARVVVGK